MRLETENKEEADFIKTHFLKPPASNIDAMLKINITTLSSLTSIVYNLVKSLTAACSITTSHKASIILKEYYTEAYDSSFESLNDNCVEFENKINEISYDIITCIV